METAEEIKDGGPCHVDGDKASWAITLICVVMLRTPNHLPRFLYRGRSAQLFTSFFDDFGEFVEYHDVGFCGG